MADTVEQLAERLAKLEQTVAEGFYDTNGRIAALDNKLDVSIESLRSDIQTVLEAVTAFTDETRRTTTSLRKEHVADRRILKLSLQDHERRTRKLERRTTSSSA